MSDKSFKFIAAFLTLLALIAAIILSNNIKFPNESDFEEKIERINKSINKTDNLSSKSITETRIVITPTFVKYNLNLTIQIVSYSQLQSLCQGNTFKKVAGCAIFDNVTNECTIIVPPLTYKEDFHTWGHELAHCTYGSWH